MYVKYVSHHIRSIVILAVKLDLLKLKIIVNHKINENKIERIEELIHICYLYIQLDHKQQAITI